MKKLLSNILYSEAVKRALRQSPYITSHIMRVVRLLRRERRNTGGSIAADYCYSVWLRHLVVAAQGGSGGVPRVVVELGPGDSIGIGLSALICGAQTYYAVDAERYANVERSLRVFDELVELFRARTPIPVGGSVADVKPPLDGYAFPADLLSEDRLEALLAPERLESIRTAIKQMASPGEPTSVPVSIAYIAPWHRDSPVPHNSADMVLSQAVLEHVDDLPAVYAAMHDWVRPGGYLSHQIDFQSHGTSVDWNGHWMYAESQWRRVRNPQTYRSINRQPCSAHLKLMQDNGFEIVSTIYSENRSGIARAELADGWSALSDADLICAGAHIRARKPSASS